MVIVALLYKKFHTLLRGTEDFNKQVRLVITLLKMRSCGNSKRSCFQIFGLKTTPFGVTTTPFGVATTIHF